MRALLQRVRKAEVTVDGKVVGEIGAGLLVLLGVADGDATADADRLWEKVRDLRIFEDEAGKTNLSLADVDGEVCVVSQFTLIADVRRGRRPSFTPAAAPDVAEALYERFCADVERDLGQVGRGVFGADMQVALVNDGPFTLMVDTAELGRPRRG